MIAVLAPSRHQVTPQVVAILKAASHPRSREELQIAAAIKDREHFGKVYLLQLLDVGWLARTLPDKPNSRLQKYKITSAGMAVIRRGQEEERHEQKAKTEFVKKSAKN